MRRFDMRLPAIVRLGGTNMSGTRQGRTSEEGADEFHTETQNVSARGVFFYLDRSVKTGSEIEVTLTFPPHVTLTDAVRVRFTARVIRIENAMPSFRVGTAAVIEDYEFLRSNESPDFFSALQRE
jgi:PilZ domain